MSGPVTVARPDPTVDSVVVFVNGFPVFIGAEVKASQVIAGLRGPGRRGRSTKS